MGLQPFCPVLAVTIYTMLKKNGLLNGAALNGLKDIKCEQTLTLSFMNICI